jgi:hypothetical protein
MKRSWIGFGLLVGVLVIALLATGFMTRIHEEVALELRQSAQCALLGEWENVQLFLTRAQRNWTKWGHLRACLMDHTPAEEMDAAFASLDIYRQGRDAIAYRAACAVLVSRMEALAEANTASWWNLF